MPRSHKTKAQWPISSQRLIKSIEFQTENLLPVFSTELLKSIPDDNTIFVKSIEFLLHMEMDQPTLPITQLSLNKNPQNFLLHAGTSISLLSNYFFQQVKNHVYYSRISFNIKCTNVNSAVICSGCIMLIFKLVKSSTNILFPR